MNHPKIVLLPSTRLRTGSAHREAVYLYALAFVGAIEPDPRFSRLSRHYRNRRGELLVTLDQVVAAIIAGDLAELEAESIAWAEAA